MVPFPRFRPFLPLASVVLVLTVTCASLAGAQTVRLSPALHYDDPAGSVRDFKLRPSGQFAFFLVDERQPGLFELFSVPALGGEPFRENLLFQPDRAVVAFDRSPASPFVVYVADQDENDVFELYSRTSSDPAPRKLSGTMTQGGDVTTFVIADDGSRVVYVADRANDEVFELWSVPVDGSAGPIRISGPLVPGGDVVGTPLVSSVTGRVVYLADQDAEGVVEIYSTGLDGSSPPLRLNNFLAPGGNVGVPVDATAQAHPPTTPEAFALSPDGSTILFLADQTTDEVWELFRGPVDGSEAPVRVHPALAADRDVVTFRISPDGTHVVYLADQVTNQVFETFSAPLDGSTPPVRISDPLQPAAWAAISPDSSNVVLVGATGLFGSPLDGSSPAVPLDSSTFAFRDVAISPDSQRVVYRLVSPGGQGECDTNVELRSVPIDGHAAAVRLDDPSGSLPETCGAVAPEVPFVIAPSSNRVFFRWSSEGPAGLVSAPIDGGPQVALSAGHVGPRFALDPTGLRVFFQADPSGGEAFDLFSAAAASGAGRVKLSRRLARDTFSDVASFQIDPAGERAVFRVDRNVDGDFQLWSARIDGQALPRRLAAGGDVTDFRLGPDGERVLFRLYQGQPTDDLLSVPADGSGAPIVLNDPIPAGGDRVGDYRFSRDGTRALWAIGTTAGHPFALYSAPVAGGASPTLLASAARTWVLEAGPRAPYTEGSLPTNTLHSVPVAGGASLQIAPGLGGYYDNLRLTPDGSRVVFSAGDPLADQNRLYSVPLDGSAGPTLHSAALMPSPAKLSPDGQWVLFSSDGLHGARIDGTLGPVSLSGPLVPGGWVPYDSSGPVAWFTPDSSRVVYLADQDTDEVYELYGAPVDGSEAPVKLSGPLVNGGDVLASNTGGLQITPDGTRAVFAADKTQDGVAELWVVPIDGSAAPLLLSATMGASTVLDIAPQRTFRITPDSLSVVYVTDEAITAGFLTQHLHEMFLVPIDRSSEPIRLNGPLANSGYQFTGSDPAGGVESFALSADSRRVVWSATQRAEVLELFGTVLTDELLPVHPAPGGGRHP